MSAILFDFATLFSASLVASGTLEDNVDFAPQVGLVSTSRRSAALVCLASLRITCIQEPSAASGCGPLRALVQALPTV